MEQTHVNERTTAGRECTPIEPLSADCEMDDVNFTFVDEVLEFEIASAIFNFYIELRDIYEPLFPKLSP